MASGSARLKQDEVERDWRAGGNMDQALSQDEINLLLNGALPEQEEEDAPAGENASAEDDAPAGAGVNLPEHDRKVLAGTIDASMKKASESLSKLIKRPARSGFPAITETTWEGIKDRGIISPDRLVAQVSYTEGLEGDNFLIISMHDAAVIVNLMMGGDGRIETEDLDDLKMSAVGEAMNQMMGSSATAYSDIFEKKVIISTPTLKTANLYEDDRSFYELVSESMILVDISLTISLGDADEVTLDMCQIIPIANAVEMIKNSLPGSGLGAAFPSSPHSFGPGESPDAAVPDPGAGVEPDAAEAADDVGSLNAWAAAEERKEALAADPQHEEPEGPGIWSPEPQMASSPHSFGPGESPDAVDTAEPRRAGTRRAAPWGSGPQNMEAQNMEPQRMDEKKVTVQAVQFMPFDAGNSRQDPDVNKLELIYDVGLQLTVELGRTEKTLKEILEIGPGSIVGLDKIAGEPLDILVNGKLLAKGEVIVIDENYGVRIKEILSSGDRFRGIRTSTQ
jgi:flagellar motor switch protein FliN/FliY